jgi:hypothetical protein
VAFSMSMVYLSPTVAQAVMRLHKKNAGSQWHGDFLREGTYLAYELFPQQGNKIMQVPLGQIKSVSKNDLSVGLKLVPLSFRRYDDMQSSKEAIKVPYPHSYIYLFKDGYLWRELEINLLGRLYEVDLPYFAPGKMRYASAELTQGVLLPIEDAQGKHEFHVAVSHVRWSWRMIHIMGGLDPADTRYSPAHHLPLAKDQDFINARLQKIDIHQLILSGEICTSIEDSCTQDALTANIHESPPQESRDWIVDRDKLNHSTGTTQISNHLIWDIGVVPELPSYVHPNSPEAKKVTIVPGAAIFILQDPLGRLIETSEFMVDEHCKHLDYLKEHGAAYQLESSKKDGEDYCKHVQEYKRVSFISQYEKKIESHHAMMKESWEVLKYWYESSLDLNQWEDFHRITQDKVEIPLVAKKYHEITENMYAAFMLSSQGVTYLRAHSLEKFHRMISIVYLIKIQAHGGYVKEFNYDLRFANILPKEKPMKELAFIFEVPLQGEFRIEVSLLITSDYGLIRLGEERLKLVSSQPTSEGSRWELRATHALFNDAGVLGQLQIQLYETRSGVFLGEDAYEFEYLRGPNLYEFKKVLYESHS